MRKRPLPHLNPLDPAERALQRRLFLEEQCSLQGELENLISSAETSPFTGKCEEDGVAAELAAYIDQVIEDYSPCPQSFNQLLRDTLVHSFFDSVQFHKNISHRKIGGSYFRHPAFLFHILLAAGCTDIQTFLTAFDHDIPEELQKIARREGNTQPEEQIIESILVNIRSQRYTTLRELGYSQLQARSIRNATSLQTACVTKRDGQLYYGYVGGIFAPTPLGLSKANQLRCMRVKYTDATANLMDLCSPQSALLRHDDITDEIIVHAFRNEDEERIRRLTQKTRRLGLPDSHPDTEHEELKGSDWMKTLYKATTVRQAERIWTLPKHTRDPVIAAIPLSELIIDTAQEVINHLCTYHSGGFPGQLTPQKVYEVHKEHLDYKTRGGYEGVTPAGSHQFDGLLSRFFDTSVRGDSTYIRSLDNDRVMMLRAAFAFRELGQRFHANPSFYLKGLSEQGLAITHPALV